MLHDLKNAYITKKVFRLGINKPDNVELNQSYTQIKTHQRSQTALKF